MMKSLFVFVLALGLGLAFGAAAGQTMRPRLQHTLRDRHDAKQVERLINEGAKLLQQGKTRLAAEKFRQALQLEPENDRAHAYAAEVAWKQQRYEVARYHAGEALRFNLQNARAHLILGRLLMREGRTLAAFDHLRKAADAIPDENEKGETVKLLIQLRGKHPEWFGRPSPVSDPKLAETQPSLLPPMRQPTGGRPNLAVFTFAETNQESQTQGWGESLAEMLTTALINSGSYRIIERNQLHKVLEEQALGQSGALDSETAVAIGKIMGLDAVVVGSVSELKSALESDARILNVETGEAIAATHARAASPDDLRQIAEALAKDISNYATAVPVRAQVDTTAGAKK